MQDCNEIDKKGTWNNPLLKIPTQITFQIIAEHKAELPHHPKQMNFHENWTLALFQTSSECTTGKIADEHCWHSKWQLGWETALKSSIYTNLHDNDSTLYLILEQNLHHFEKGSKK